MTERADAGYLTGNLKNKKKEVKFKAVYDKNEQSCQQFTLKSVNFAFEAHKSILG